MISDRLRDSYDAVPYTSRPIPQSHPDRLHALARLHGLAPAPVTDCRVLELGAATGGNLLPMAAQLPDSEFVGLDLSERQVAAAAAAGASLGLSNLRFLAGDVCDRGVTEPLGQFDYVIAHGLYSWVPETVQAALPGVIAGLLAPGGIAYVSYNTYPGWQQRGLVRRFLLDAVAGLEPPAARAAEARAALDLLIETEQAGGAYGQALREEQRRMAVLDDSYLLHDLLEAENHPVWFSDFADAVAAAGLRYVSESNLSASVPENFPPQLRQILARCADPLVREQRIDFWLNRSLRESLLCHAESGRDPTLSPDNLVGLWAATALRPDAECDLEEGTEAFFSTPAGVRIGLRGAPVKRALIAMATDAPVFASLDALGVRCRAPELVQQLVFDLVCRNLAELSPRPSAYVARAGIRPQASALARWQCAGGLPSSIVTNQRHQAVTLDDSAAARLLPLLDGRRDRDELAMLAAGGDRRTLDITLDALAAQALLVA